MPAPRAPKGAGGAHKRQRRLPDQDLAWLRRLLQASSDVDRVARGQALLGAGDDLAGGDPDAAVDAERGERFAHLDRGPQRPQGVVLVHDRHAENGHHGVSDELLHRAAVALDDLLHALEVAGEQRPERFRIC